MNLVWQMHPVRSMGGQVWCVLWPSRGAIDALRVVLLYPLPQPSGRLLTLDGDGADSIDETLASSGCRSDRVRRRLLFTLIFGLIFGGSS